jgi:transcriptional regulator with XRE-family HTH domain
MLSIPDKIRTLRSIKRITQTELSERSGIGINYISAIESGAIARFERRILEELGYNPSMDDMLIELSRDGEPEAATV